jgi:hypothetical protein
MLKKSRIKAKITIGIGLKQNSKEKRNWPLATAAGDTISYQLAMLHQYSKFVYFMKVV